MWCFLFLAHGVDGRLLPTLSTLALQQTAPTDQTMTLCKQILNYIALQPEAILTYNASNMVLATHSNASYLSESSARSCAGGHMFMAANKGIPSNNSAILNISQIICAVMSSAARAKLGALFVNTKTAISMRQTLQELSHPQPWTPI
jgi:hypothetical protein